MLDLEILPSYLDFDDLSELSTEIELLSLPEDIYPETLENNENSPLDTLLASQNITFDSFFAAQLIDIPTCFQKSHSLYRAQSFDLKSRLINTIARHGRKPYVTVLYSKILQTMVTRMWSEDIENAPHKNIPWQLLYFSLTSLGPGSSPKSLALTPLPNVEFVDHLNEIWERDDFTLPTFDSVHEALDETLEEYNPVFTFYIRRVDKMKRKHSRGKSGKYSIIWKYVPEYKRSWIVIRWLAKDIKFQRSRTLEAKMTASFELLFFNKTNHLAYQLRHFVHKFVFQNHRKTLLRSLKSTS